MVYVTALLSSFILSLATLSQAIPVSSLDQREDFPYQLLKKTCINQDCSATRITISNPPINLWNSQLIREFNSYLLSINNTEPSTPKIVVVSSDVQDFYIAHLDLHLFSAANPDPTAVDPTEVLSTYFQNLALLQSIPVIFVAEVNGRAWGAGDEHAMQMDMRFASPEAIFSAPEAALGVIHVGGIQWLVQSIGPSRTLEFMLSSAQVNATEAARVGWVNSVYATAEGLRENVDALVIRIAKFETDAIRALKKSVSQQKPTQEMFEKDQAAFAALAANPSLQNRVDRFLELSQDQSREWELNNSENIVNYLL